MPLRKVRSSTINAQRLKNASRTKKLGQLSSVLASFGIKFVIYFATISGGDQVRQENDAYSGACRGSLDPLK